MYILGWGRNRKDHHEFLNINDPLVRSGYATFYILLKTKQNKKKKTFSMWRTLRNQRQATETNSSRLQAVISDALDTVRIAASNLNALIGVIATKNAWNELRKLHALVMHNEVLFVEKNGRFKISLCFVRFKTTCLTW